MSAMLYLGDCREILPNIQPTQPVDAVITDPVWPNCPHGLFSGWDTPTDLLAEALALISAKRVVIIMRYDSDPRFLAAVPDRWPFFRTQILRYAIPGYNGRKLGGIEMAYCFGEPVPSAPGRRVIPGYSPIVTRPTRVAGHPSPRSLDHIRWLVDWWSDPGETVLDPFMGSGTTGVACVQTKRNFVGIEIDPGYFEIAKARIFECQKEEVAS